MDEILLTFLRQLSKNTQDIE